MRAILFVLLITLALCQNDEILGFRFLNGHLKPADNRNFTVDGTIYYEKLSVYELEFGTIKFFGLEMSTKTRFSVIGNYKVRSDTKDGAEIDITFECVAGVWGDDFDSLFGTITLKGSWDAAVLSSNCITEDGKRWTFGAVAKKSDTLYYPPAEAGMRAKNLIGESIEKFQAPAVIHYAVFDNPYISLDCGFMLYEDYPDAPGPEPGALIVGKRGDHCGILDNEGTKFTHSSKKDRIVAYDSLATISTHFPHGHVYKRYPDKPRLTYMKSHLRAAKY